MSDGNDTDRATSGTASAVEKSVPTIQLPRNGLNDYALSNGALPVANGGVSPARRAFNIHNLLNEAVDEVVAGSDHEGERETEICTTQPYDHQQPSSAVAASVDATVEAAIVDRVGHDGAVELLLGFTHSTASRPHVSAATKALNLDKAFMSSGAAGRANEASNGQRDMAMEASANGVPVESTGVVGGNGVERVAVEESRTVGGRPIRRTRPPIRFTATEDTPTTLKPAKTPHDEAGALVPPPEVTAVVGETPPQETRPAREKRRPPMPSPVRTTPVKKSKTTPNAARPKRTAAAAVTNYTDVTGSNNDEVDDDNDAVMRSTDHADAAMAMPSNEIGTGPVGRVSKRKLMSQRQLDELLADDRGDVEEEAVRDVVIMPHSTSHHASPGVRLHACEFCRVRHSAHPTYVCHACRRVYHDKCLLDQFTPMIDDREPIEAQMDRLSLHRPTGHSAMLRCVSCQAALIDFCNNRGVHWECQCPTCTTSPQQIADYRRVSLKRIIDEHNLDIALKKEMKATGGASKKDTKKTPAKAGKAPMSGVKASAKSSARVAEENSRENIILVTVTGRNRGRGNRRARADEESISEGFPPASDAKGHDPTHDTTTKANPPPPPARVRPGRRARAPAVTVKVMKAATRPLADPLVMDVEQAMSHVPTQVPNFVSGSTTNHNAMEMDVLDSSDAERVTVSNLDELVAITKDAASTWAFKIACSPSRKANESGTYKEAVLFWHPARGNSVTCSCCDKVDQSLTWFVDHTDPSLLALAPPLTKNEDVCDLYSFLFVLQRNGDMVPLQDVLRIVREKHSKTTTPRHSPPARKPNNRGRVRGAVGNKETVSNNRHDEALALLRNINYTMKPVVEERLPGPGPKKRGAITPAKFSCNVLCAEIDKWLKPLTSTPSTLRNLLADCEYRFDVFKTGTFDMCESAKNPKTCMIRCHCCQQIFNAGKFVQHTREPFLLEQQREVDQQQADARARGKDHHSDAEEEDADVNGTGNKKIRSFVCVAGVPTRDPLVAVRLEHFLGALDKLGNQVEINKAIAGIVKIQEGNVNPSNL